jgi:hypothetical protein
LRRALIRATLLCALLTIPASVAAQRRPLISSDPGYFAPPGEPDAIGWTAGDEHWYLRNRRIAIAGKVLTVLGLAATFAIGVPREDNVLVVAGVATQLSGQLAWSIADLRAANYLRGGGHRVGRGAGIAAVCGAVLLSPVVWIAGPIQSAQLRRAHATSLPRSTAYGLGAQLMF